MLFFCPEFGFLTSQCRFLFCPACLFFCPVCGFFFLSRRPRCLFCPVSVFFCPAAFFFLSRYRLECFWCFLKSLCSLVGGLRYVLTRDLMTIVCVFRLVPSVVLRAVFLVISWLIHAHSWTSAHLEGRDPLHFCVVLVLFLVLLVWLLLVWTSGPQGVCFCQIQLMPMSLPPGLHTTTGELQTCDFRAPALQAGWASRGGSGGGVGGTTQILDARKSCTTQNRTDLHPSVEVIRVLALYVSPDRHAHNAFHLCNWARQSCRVRALR